MSSIFIQELGRPVAYFPTLAQIIGVSPCVLMCQLLYWSDKGDDPDWVYKSQTELTEETGLLPDAQRTARKKLVSLGLLEERYKRIEHRLYFRVNRCALDSMLGIATSRSGESPLGEVGNPHFVNRTETTTETTTKNIVLSEEFDSEIWPLYPEKSGKTRARACYIKARAGGEDKESIIAGLKRYLEYVSSRRAGGFKDLRYKNGGTWFHQRCWEDEMVTEENKTSDDNGEFRRRMAEYTAIYPMMLHSEGRQYLREIRDSVNDNVFSMLKNRLCG